MKAGLARISITPPVGLFFGGKTHGDPPAIQSVCSDIYARAIVFEERGFKVALVSVELCYLHAHWVNQIRRRIAAKTDLAAENICVAATHNHAGPDTFLHFDRHYVEDLLEKVADCVCRAAADLVEVRLGTASCAIEGPATNRRIRLRDGSVRMRAIGFEPPPPDEVIAPGPVDPQLRVLRVESRGGRLLALLCNYACHASVALESDCVSGDFPGYAAEKAERQTGALFLFTAGSSANINPVAYCRERSDREARRVGEKFCDDVVALAAGAGVGKWTAIEMHRRSTVFPIRGEFLCESEAPPMRIPTGAAMAWFPTSLQDEIRKIKRMEENSILPPVLRKGEIACEMTRLTLGPLTLLTIPGELFVEIGLDILSGAPKPCWIVTHANDAIGYIPTAVAFSEGGYESAPFALSLLTPEAEAIVKRTAVELLAK